MKYTKETWEKEFEIFFQQLAVKNETAWWLGYSAVGMFDPSQDFNKSYKGAGVGWYDTIEKTVDCLNCKTNIIPGPETLNQEYWLLVHGRTKELCFLKKEKGQYIKI